MCVTMYVKHILYDDNQQVILEELYLLILNLNLQNQIMNDQ
jgi:hypothetical protein